MNTLPLVTYARNRLDDVSKAEAIVEQALTEPYVQRKRTRRRLRTVISALCQVANLAPELLRLEQLIFAQRSPLDAQQLICRLKDHLETYQQAIETTYAPGDKWQ